MDCLLLNVSKRGRDETMHCTQVEPASCVLQAEGLLRLCYDG